VSEIEAANHQVKEKVGLIGMRIGAVRHAPPNPRMDGGMCKAQTSLSLKETK
jgi:hypothetical protein